MNYRVRKVKGVVASTTSKDVVLANSSSAQLRWLSATQVKARYGNLSDMSLWRWLADTALGFPQPTVINRRRFWREDYLDAWDARRLAERSAE
jgi:predicted DNA-binding transcriptional regulator AlpA